MRQRFTRLLAVVMGLLGGRAMAYDIAVKNEEGVTIYYRYTGDGKELQVTYGNLAYNSYAGKVNIPQTVTFKNRTRPVTSVGHSAFAACEGLKSVALPQTVTQIGEHAFQSCQKLKSVSLPDNVESIGRYAFAGCNSLTGITIPSKVKTIAASAFLSCTELTTVVLPTGLETIGEGAFRACRRLKSVTIPQSVTRIEANAFDGCRGLKEVAIGEGVRSIGSGAFARCEQLTGLSIPQGVTTIGSHAFAACKSLDSVVMPDHPLTIGAYAFRGCERLRQASFGSLGSLCEMQFGNAEANPLFHAHRLCVEGQEIAVVEIPEGIPSIGDYAFCGCRNITQLIVSNSVESIGTDAFKGSLHLCAVKIGRGIKVIKPGAFDGTELESIEMRAESPISIYGKESENPVFNEKVYNNATLFVPQGCAEKYKSKRGWWDFIWIKEMK